MPTWLRRLAFELPFFCLACILVGFVFTVSALSVRDRRFEFLFRENTLTALSIGLTAFLSGFAVYLRVYPAALSSVYAKSLTASLAGGLVGRTLAALLNHLHTGEWPLTGIDFFLSYIPALAMTFLIATGYIGYWYYCDEKKPATDVLEIRAEGKLCYVPANEICYLTAVGKKTVVHTENTDYTVNMLLKDFLQKFPVPGLLRTHKKHAVQTRVIDFLRPGRSGEYLASVAGDAFIVPVSPKFLPQIRRAKKR